MKPQQFVKIDDNIIGFVARMYERTEKSLIEDVQKLKDWMQTQPHFPEILDDKRIENFFLLNKCSMEKTKQAIDMYYTIRTLIPDMFENIHPNLPQMQELMDIAYCTILPRLTNDMYRVLAFKIRNEHLIDKMEPHNVMGLLLNIQELRLKEDVMFGDIVILDLKGINMGYVAKLTPSIVSKFLTIYEKVFSMRIKAVYIINSQSFINTVLNILKTIMKPKLFDRIHVCQDTSILSNIPKEILPKDYGGDESSLEQLQEILKEKFVQYQDRFDRLEKLRVNNSLRPAKLENDELLGFHGNFKKLSVD
jgi:hypothetical protein